jgi:hypothetical protein
MSSSHCRSAERAKEFTGVLQGLAQLGAALRVLDLSWTAVSDDSLPLLTALTALHTLDLSSTRVSGVGLASLRSMRCLETRMRWL